MTFKWHSDEAKRISLLPILHPDIWAYRKKIEALHWVAQEVDLIKDKNDWINKMNPDQKHFIKMQLAFFATIDIDVMDNIGINFEEEVNCMEAKMVYAAQKDQECVHAESYSLQIEAVMDGAEREETLNAVRSMPVIKMMRDWVLQWFDRSSHEIGERLIAFAAVEGVLFSASFSALQWLRELNILPGITNYNTFIVRDEGVHTLFTCLIIREYLAEKPNADVVYKIFNSVVEIIDIFVAASLPIRLNGMNKELMQTYVRYQADNVIRDMGYQPLFSVENPFPFMNKMLLNDVSKTNFFESRPTQYQNLVKTDNVRLYRSLSSSSEE